MIGSLVVGSRVKAAKTTRKGNRIDINVYTGTVIGFTATGLVRIKPDDSKHIKSVSSVNCKVISGKQ